MGRSRGGDPVGFALVQMLAADLPHLDEVSVAPAHGRCGLGTALVRTVGEWAAASSLMPEARAVMAYRCEPVDVDMSSGPQQIP